MSKIKINNSTTTTTECIMFGNYFVSETFKVLVSIQLAPLVGDQKWYSTPTQWFFKANRRRRRYEQKLNENEQYATQSRENESRFHYLCLKVQVFHCS